MPLLRTGRLVLVDVDPADVDRLVELNSDPAVLRFVTGGAAPSRERVLEKVSSSLGERWTVWVASSGEFAGWVGAQSTGPGERELGYRLARRFWGRGFASEAASAVVDHVFTDGGCVRVWAQAMTVNVASIRVLERCGLSYVRTVHLEWPEPVDGDEFSDVEFELLRDVWAARQAAPVD